MNTSANSVDVLMATYNGEKYLAEQIDSIIAQTYENWRLLISDDGSSDATVEIAQRYAARDPRIILVESRNELGGAAGNFYGLLSYVTAPYAAFCDQDDVWMPQKIEEEMHAMQSLENAGGDDISLLAFCDSRVVDARLNEIQPSFIDTLGYRAESYSFAQALVGNIAQGCTMLFNKHLVATMLQRPSPSSVGIHDWWAIIIALGCGQIAFVPDALVAYRQHSANAVGATRSNSFTEWTAALAKTPGRLSSAQLRAREDASKALSRASDVLNELGGGLVLRKPRARTKNYRLRASWGHEKIRLHPSTWPHRARRNSKQSLPAYRLNGAVTQTCKLLSDIVHVDTPTGVSAS